MLNDLTTPLSLLQTRRSGKPRELAGSGPTAEEMAQILTIAARTPDHGKIAPWRFITVATDQRERFAALLVEALAAEDPAALPAKRAKAEDFARTPGALVVLISAPVAGHKIPVWEQELSAGTSAMNLLLAAHAMGFVAGWITGWYTYSPMIRAALCGPGEQIAGFIFIGHPARELEERERPSLSEVWRAWQPAEDEPAAR